MTRLETAEDLVEQVAQLFHHMPKNESTQELWSRICSFRGDREVKTKPIFNAYGRHAGMRLVDPLPPITNERGPGGE